MSKGPFIKGVPIAPFTFFDGVASWSVRGMIVELTMTAHVVTMPDQGITQDDYVAVNHLRGSREAMISLRTAIDQALAKYEELAAAQMRDSVDRDGYVEEEEPSPGKAFIDAQHRLNRSN